MRVVVICVRVLADDADDDDLCTFLSQCILDLWRDLHGTYLYRMVEELI